MRGSMAHDLPQWFDDAKFGIFVHWTAAAVPAFAPVGPSVFELAAEHGWEHTMAHNPYVEWYQNSVAIEGSPATRHHREHYGDLPYDTFVEQFRAGHGVGRPDVWADLFAATGTRYVVLVTKHHDGVLLWPERDTQPAQGALAVGARPRRRPRPRGPRPRHALRHVLQRRARLDLRRAADERLRVDARAPFRSPTSTSPTPTRTGAS